jgi:V8-like Glu-specific endopeptidase
VAAKRVARSASHVSAYWTASRMAHATPLTVQAPTAETGEAWPAPWAHSATKPPVESIVIPPAAPQGWQPQTTSPPAAGDRESRTDGTAGPGPIPFTSAELTDTTSYPTRTHGIVFFTLGKFDYSCSGTAVSSVNQSVVMTAGHCVNEGGKHQSWATNFLFVPGYQDHFEPFGAWPARRLFTTKGWRRRARFSGDVGAATMSPNAAGQTVEAAIGARGIAFDLPREQTYRAYGYPVSPRPKFDGESLWACDSQYGYSDPFPELKGPPQSAIGCDMEAGASGGGWVIDDQYVNSTSSFGYSFLPGVLFGSYYGDLAAQVYGRAAAG